MLTPEVKLPEKRKQTTERVFCLRPSGGPCNEKEPYASDHALWCEACLLHEAYEYIDDLELKLTYKLGPCGVRHIDPGGASPLERWNMILDILRHANESHKCCSAYTILKAMGMQPMEIIYNKNAVEY